MMSQFLQKILISHPIIKFSISLHVSHNSIRYEPLFRSTDTFSCLTTYAVRTNSVPFYMYIMFICSACCLDKVRRFFHNLISLRSNIFCKTLGILIWQCETFAVDLVIQLCRLIRWRLRSWPSSLYSGIDGFLAHRPPIIRHSTPKNWHWLISWRKG